MVQIEEVGADEPTTVRVHGRVSAPTSSTPNPDNRPRPSAQARSSSGPRSQSPNGDSGLFDTARVGFPSASDLIFISGARGHGGPGAGPGLGGEQFIAFTTRDGGGVVHMVGIPPVPPEMLAKPRPLVVQPLTVSLEMLYMGGMVSCCVKSQATDALGPVEPERIKYFDVEVLPGYKHGTQIKFDRCFPDDELYPGEPKVDVTFIVHEQKHTVFKRRGFNIHVEVKLTKEQLAAESFEVSLLLLNGRTEVIRGSRGTCSHGAKRVLPGLGMPVRREGRATSEFGNLIIRFTWPMNLRFGGQCCTVS